MKENKRILPFATKTTETQRNGLNQFPYSPTPNGHILLSINQRYATRSSSNKIEEINANSRIDSITEVIKLNQRLAIN